ncbi:MULTISPECIES: DUF4892 domain-containing protein [Pseudomonas]|uniref:DUF4892 domain-containing protein n=1 Tax=Pseudomonas TaxID=286 RepID=UPI001BE569EB|nr:MULTISPECIES: DUF4892 domain-containing protein [Pseudomonas]MBT2340465.1 DUF4892 domain-containing protein [Pseudomonas fluorescens]MCD4530676.1 DUF4892 domain-containing protein [Pseudomonas sp. C3-2018]
MKLSVHSLVLLMLACVSPASFAADVPGSHDLEGVPRMPDAQIVDYRQTADLERVFPMGSIRKISGQLRFDGQVDARGDVTSVTYELPPEHTATQAFTAAREALQKQGAELLFWCQARDCGESSLWANEVFGNAKLYGADNGQAYLLLRLAPPADNTLIALYGITRGNRKAYLHVEQFVASTALGDVLPTSATLLRQLKDTGVLDLPRLAGEPDDTWLRLLSRALNLDTGLRVSIAGPRAEDWLRALVGQGVRTARLETARGDAVGLHLELLR